MLWGITTPPSVIKTRNPQPTHPLEPRRTPETRNPPTHFGAAGKKMAGGWISNAVAAVKFGHLQLITPNM